MLRRLIAFATLLAAVATAAAAPKPAAAAPARHGDLVSSAPLIGPWPRNGNALAGAARNLRITYKVRGINGRLVNATGTLALPRGRAPRDGWPVFSWAHGTTGIADRCAPSRSNLDSGSNALLNRIARAGFVVARTDYEGLGGPGEHPYLNGVSEGRSVLDIVRAARKRYRSIGARLEIGGHSQGGHAALWAASLAKTYTPELRLGGTLASAPASHHGDRAPLIRMLDSSDLSPLVALILRGADIGDPSLQIASKLTAEARALWPLTLTECYWDLALRSPWATLPTNRIGLPDADMQPLVDYLDANDPESLTIRTPVLVQQGLADTLVWPALSEALVKDINSRRGRMTLREYPGLDHYMLQSDARPVTDALAFLRRNR